jgi:hypothetical protein
MKRAIFVSLSFLFLGSIAGCGSASNYGGGGGGNPTPNVFKGQYAILLTGLDGTTGNQVGIAGSLTADGLGHISTGEVDINDNGTVTSATGLAGTYSFDAAGNSTLGSIVLTSTVGSLQHLGFYFSLKANGDFGQIMSSDANNFVATGTMQLQSSPILTLSGMAGDYVVTIDGRGETQPTAELGRFTLSSGGASSNVALDQSISGTGTTSFNTVSVTFNPIDPDANGRGILTVTNFGNPSQNFAYYAITSNRIVAVEIDAVVGRSLVADFSRQQNSTPFTASSVITTGSVFGVTGVDTVVGSDIVAAGQLVITGAGSNTGTLSWDSNDNGAINGPASATGQTVAFDPNTGRGTITVTNGVSTGLFDSAVFYLTAPGTGFIMDATTGTTNRAMTGILTAQLTAPGSISVNTDLSGLGIFRSRGASNNDVLSLIGLFGPTTTPASGTYAINYDIRDFGPTSQLQTLADQNIPSPGITLGTTLNAGTGRGTFSLPVANSTPATEAFYVIGPNQFVFIDISPAGSAQNGESTLFIVSPD